MSAPPIRVFAHHAMATVFEIRIAGGEPAYARQAAQAGFALIDRLEALLSRFQETSEVACINRLQPGEWLRLCPDTFDCLRLAWEMHTLTGGAFDPGLGRAMDRLRAPGAAAEGEPDARAPGQLLLDPDAFSVGLAEGAVALDLGAIGKGFALDRVAELLREWDIEAALLISGGSSIKALAGPAPGEAWEVLLASREDERLWLRDFTLGSSGTAVKGEHILDPLTGQPARACHRAWALSDSAAVSDALSTAWMSLTPEEVAEVCRLRPGTGAILQRTASPDDPLLWLGAARAATRHPRETLPDPPPS